MPLRQKIKKALLFILKHKLKKSPVLHRHISMYCACSFLHSRGSVCLANLGASCLHNGGSWRPGVPSLVKLHEYIGRMFKMSSLSLLTWLFRQELYDMYRPTIYCFG